MEIIDKKHKRVSRTLQNYLGDLVIDGILTVVFMLPVLYGYLRLVEEGGERFYFFLLIFTLLATIAYVQVYPYLTISSISSNPSQTQNSLPKSPT